MPHESEFFLLDLITKRYKHSLETDNKQKQVSSDR